jgi:hypothetical protein
MCGMSSEAHAARNVLKSEMCLKILQGVILETAKDALRIL